MCSSRSASPCSLARGCWRSASRCFRSSAFSQAVRDDALAVLAICALEMVLHNIPAILVMGVFRAGGHTLWPDRRLHHAVYLIGLPLTMLVGLYLHWSVPMTYLVMYLSEDIIKVQRVSPAFRSYKWIRPR